MASMFTITLSLLLALVFGIVFYIIVESYLDNPTSKHVTLDTTYVIQSRISSKYLGFNRDSRLLGLYASPNDDSVIRFVKKNNLLLPGFEVFAINQPNYWFGTQVLFNVTPDGFLVNTLDMTFYDMDSNNFTIIKPQNRVNLVKIG